MLLVLNEKFSRCWHGTAWRLGVLWLVLALSPAAVAGGQRVRFTTFNVNFNSTNQEIKEDVQAVSATTDIISMEEAKTVTIDNFLDDAWTVIQVVNQGDAKRGSAIAIRKSVITRVRGSGIVLGCRHHDFAMLDRYIAWADVEFTNGRILRVLALHYPPLRFDDLWPEMTANFVAFVNGSPYPVIAGADWNFTVTNDPQKIQRDTGLRARGVGIDGFFYDESVIEFVSIAKQTGLNVNSDHDPVRMIVDVLSPDAGVGDWALY